MRKKFTILTAALALLAMLAVPKGGWGQTQQLFHETFGNNSGSARDWDDSYSEKSGVEAVYTDVAYTMTNVKQGKNTTGSSGSGLNQSSQGTDAVFVFGPLHVGNYTNMSLTYQWKAASIKADYSTSIYYKTSSNGTYTEITHNAQGATSFVEVNVDLPEEAQTNTLYLKIVWNTSNTQAIIDEVDITGIEASTSSLAAPTFTPAGGVFEYDPNRTVSISSEDEGVSFVYTTDGSDPRTSGTADVYGDPISITTTTTLKAAATTDLVEFSMVTTAQYSILPSMDVVVPADNPTYVYNDNVQSFSWYVLSGATTHGTTITEKGFVYSTTNNLPTTADTKIVVTSNDLEATLTGLAASTSYYVRSYAISEGQTVYSSTATLTTTAFPTYDIQFVVNGESYGDMVSVSGAIGEVINTQPAANLIPDGYTFAGWSTEDETINIIDGTYAPSDDMFLYAVFSITEYGEPVTNYQKVTETPSDWSGDYLIVYESGYSTGNLAFNGGLNVLDAVGNTISVSITDGAISSTDATDAAIFTIAAVTNGYSIKSASGFYIGNTSNGNALKTSTENDYVNTLSISSQSADIVSSNSHLRYNSNSSQTRFRYFKSDTYTSQKAIQLYKKTSTIPSVTKQYTRIMDVTSTTATMANIPVTYKVTVKNNGILTLTGTNSGTAANLIIEDGGQLITSNAVAATVQKQVKGFNDTEDGGWKMIASPVLGTIGIANVAQLNSGEIYRYDEPSHFWRYYEGEGAPFTTLANQTGYLYGNENDVTLEFAGTLVPSDDEVTINNLSYTATIEEEANPLAGWNLVGNPFACNAYTTKSYYVTSYDPNEPNNTILGEYAASMNEPIPPCTGILVQATNEDRTISFANSSYSIEESTNNGILEMAVAQQVVNRSGVSMAVKDKAMVSFNAGDELGKFVFNEDNAKLYIPQNGKDYAIAYSNGQGEMPVNFRAAKNGTYTLTVNPEGVEMNYLHLIDNMTGADVDLLATSSYTFNATTRDYESRFRLVFAANNENGVSAGSTTFAYFSNGSLVVNNEGNATLQVVDVMGRIVKSESINGSASINVNAAPGVYTLRLVNGNDVKTQKVVVR